MIDSVPISKTDDDSKSAATIEFVVENFSQVKEPITSPPCMIRYLSWRLLIKPSHETSPDQYLPRSFGFFLQCDGESENSSWSCSATTHLIVVSQQTGVDNLIRKIQHSFNSKECEGGFANFMTQRELFDPNREFIKNDKVIFRAHVLADSPVGLKRCNLRESYNHRKLTNVEAFARVLYHINPFKKAVCDSHVESCGKTTLAFQKVFHNIQNNEPICVEDLIETETACGTAQYGKCDTKKDKACKDLIRLLGQVGENLKNTSSEEIVPKLFEGNMKAVITVNGSKKFYGERLHPFRNVKVNPDKSSLNDAVGHYVPKTFRNIISFCPKEIEVDVIYETLPPVLIIRCKRPSVGRVRFEFYEKINLKSLLKNPESISPNYTLFAVMAHSNDEENKYEVFIDPRASGEWSVFTNGDPTGSSTVEPREHKGQSSDGCLMRCSTLEAIEHNYGKDLEGCTIRAAHLLFYIRDSEMKDILQEEVRNEDDIPEEKIEVECTAKSDDDKSPCPGENESFAKESSNVVM